MRGLLASLAVFAAVLLVVWTQLAHAFDKAAGARRKLRKGTKTATKVTGLGRCLLNMNTEYSDEGYGSVKDSAEERHAQIQD